MMPIIVAAIRWGHHWKGRQVVVGCDNIAIATALKIAEAVKHICYADAESTLFMEAYYCFKVVSEYITDSNNN